MKFELDPTKSPATIDLKADGIEFKGIYRFDGKRLKICYNKDTRPTRFDAEEQAAPPHNVLYVLEIK